MLAPSRWSQSYSCLDEPFSALDVLSADALRGELLELWSSGTMPTKAILMVTHNIEEAVWVADRIVVMQKEPGRVVTEVEVSLPYPRLMQKRAIPTSGRPGLCDSGGADATGAYRDGQRPR